MSDRLKLFLPLVVFLLVAAVFLSLQWRMQTGDYDPSTLPSALIGQPLPAFQLPDLFEPDTIRTQADTLGKPLLLNVWATWCVACKAEHAYLNKLAASGVHIVGLNYKDERDDALQWLERLGNPYQFNINDSDGALGLNLGVYGAPETYVLDAQGIVRYRHVGVLNDRVWQKSIIPLGLRW